MVTGCDRASYWAVAGTGVSQQGHAASRAVLYSTWPGAGSVVTRMLIPCHGKSGRSRKEAVPCVPARHWPGHCSRQPAGAARGAHGGHRRRIMVWAWFGLLFAATLGVMLLLDLSGVRPQHAWRLSTLPPSRQRRHLLLQRLLLVCAALWALIESLPHVLPSRSGYLVAQNVIAVGLAVGSGLIMIYLVGRDRRAVSEETMGQIIRRARARDNKRALVGALRAQARMLIQQRRWEEAERVLEEGLAVAQSMP